MPKPLTLAEGETTRTVNHSQMLLCKLTHDERFAYGLESASEQRKREVTQLAAKQSAASYKADLQEHDSTIKKLSDAVHSGLEERRVDCVIVYHYDTGEVTTTRTDTGEVTETRPMTYKERQMEMEI